MSLRPTVCLFIAAFINANIAFACAGFSEEENRRAKWFQAIHGGLLETLEQMFSDGRG